MTRLLEKVLESVRQLPAAAQYGIARAMLTLAGDEVEPEEISRHTCRLCLSALHRPSIASSHPIPRSKQRSAALIDEASLHAASNLRPRGHR
jgi:hypothetical protein